MKQKLLAVSWVRYALAGGLAYGIELTCILTLHTILGLSAELATALAFWVGLPTAFLLQKLFAFKDAQKTIKAISKQIVAYACLIAINYLFTLYVVATLPDDWLIFSRTLALIITTVWNYAFYRLLFNPDTRPTIATVKIALKNAFTFKNRFFNVFLLTLPIFVFNFGILSSGEKIIPGDPDYYFQIYEAFRRSVLEFGQFPLWNPWVAGGIPLFANVQFGLISVQAPLVLLFGSVMGMKVAIVVYQLIGFIGFRKLFKDGFKTAPMRAALLAYIPIFGSFFVFRTIAGHVTFLLVVFVPWLIYFYLTRKNKLSWLWFALIFSFMVWSSPHYTTIMSAVVIGMWFMCELIARLLATIRKKTWEDFWQKLRRDASFLAKAGGLIVALCAYRMYFVFEFIKDHPRYEIAQNEPFTGLWQGLYALWGPDQYSSPPTLTTGWGWAEAATYIGIGSLVCLLIVLATAGAMWLKKKGVFTYSIGIFSALFVIFFILGMGDFGDFSPYHLLNKLPVFDSMRVATRWLMWSSLIVLCVIAAYKSGRFKKTINIILLLTVLELFVTGYNATNKAFFVELQQYRPTNDNFNQVIHYHLPRPLYAGDANFNKVYFYDENLLETTRNNLGQVIAGDSLVDTRQPNSTVRCGNNAGGCELISFNAQITSWSPNIITLKRTGPGPIHLNLNPGRGWRVNGAFAFSKEKVTDPLKPFIIDDPSDTITLDYMPKFSPGWVLSKLHIIK